MDGATIWGLCKKAILLWRVENLPGTQERIGAHSREKRNPGMCERLESRVLLEHKLWLRKCQEVVTKAGQGSESILHTNHTEEFGMEPYCGAVT